MATRRLKTGVKPQPLTYSMLLLAVGIDGASYSILAPVLPALRIRTGLSNLGASLLFSGFYAGNIVGFLVGGAITARWGARRTILVGVLGQALGDLAIALFASPDIVAGARILQGLASGAVWVGAVSAVMIGSQPERLGVRLGGVIFAFAAGGVVGPALGALGGAVLPFVAHLLLEALAAAMLAAWLPRERGGFAWGDLRTLRNRQVVFACGAAALAALVLGMLEGSYSLRFASRLSQPQLSAMYVLSTICYGGSAVLAGRMRTLAGSWGLAQAGLVVAGGLVLTVSWASAPAAWFVLVACVGAAAGAADSSALGILGGARSSGVIMGLVVYSQAWSLGRLIGPVLGTSLAEQGGWLLPGSAVLAISVLFAAVTLRGRRSVAQPATPPRP